MVVDEVVLVLVVALVPVTPPVPVMPVLDVSVLDIVDEYEVSDVLLLVEDMLVPVVSLPTVALVFSTCLQPSAKSIRAATARIARDFFIASLS